MKDILGYEGLYAIEEDGRVWSYITNKYLKYHLAQGYYVVDLYKDKIGTTTKIHRLIAEAFIPNPDNKPMIDHIDQNKLNNSINNLRWATHKENMWNTSVQTNNKLQEKNIYFKVRRKQTTSGVKLYERYWFEICRDGVTHQKYFKTLEEAKVYRDNYSGFNP